MKPTDAQKKVCEVIINQVKWWRDSNDISSPSHTSLLDDELFAQTETLLSPDDRETLEELLFELLIFVRNVDNDR